MEAADATAVQARLRQQQLTPVSVKAKAGKRFSFSFGGGSVKVKELVTFTRLFATMINAGLPIVQCLDILANQQSNKFFRAALFDIKSNVEQGSTFSEAMRKHPGVFDDLFVNLVQAGEVGGILDSIMNRLSVYIEKRAKLISQVKGALTYPTIVVIIAFGVMAILLTFVIPAFETMFKNFGGGRENLPAITRMMLGASEIFVSYLWLLVLIVIGTVYGVMTAYRNPEGKRWFHRTMLTIPLIGPVMRKIAVARFTRTLGTLLQSGVPILDALEICGRTAGNLIIQEGVLSVRQAVSEGQNMADPLLRAAVFPEMVVQMISVGEQTGALDQMLNKIADFYEEETDVAVAGLTASLEPIMMVGVGGMVGVVLVAMYLPIFSLAGSIKA
ncbi:MAG TPA: type II secretion system F family protein [Polyangiaceae bacterium]|nr:type II secretion system F family protein [Polyangiaceae bacterium]